MNKLEKAGGVWKTIVHVDGGFVEYKFYVDGMWMLDATKPTITDAIGNVNNYIKMDATGTHGIDAEVREEAEKAVQRWQALLAQRPSFATSPAVDRPNEHANIDSTRLQNQFDALNAAKKPKTAGRGKQLSSSPYAKPLKEYQLPPLKMKSKKPKGQKQKIIGDDEYKKKR